MSAESIIASALGLVFFGCVGVDTRAYLSNVSRPKVGCDFNALPGGIVMAPGLEFFRCRDDGYASLENFASLERHGGQTFRHAMGPDGTLKFFTQRNTAQLGFVFVSIIPDQDVTISFDGKVVDRLTHLGTAPVVRSYPLATRAGNHEVSFSYGRYQHDGAHESPDPRRLAGDFNSLELTTR